MADLIGLLLLIMMTLAVISLLALLFVAPEWWDLVQDYNWLNSLDL